MKDEVLYTTRQAVRYLTKFGVLNSNTKEQNRLQAMRRWRMNGSGPAFRKINGTNIFYTKSSLDVFIKGRNNERKSGEKDP